MTVVLESPSFSSASCIACLVSLDAIALNGSFTPVCPSVAGVVLPEALTR